MVVVGAGTRCTAQPASQVCSILCHSNFVGIDTSLSVVLAGSPLVALGEPHLKSRDGRLKCQ